MIPIKNKAQIEKMREVCQIAANVLEKVVRLVQPGITTYDLDLAGKRFMAEYGAHSACFNYRVGDKSYPAHTCLSVNEEVVHGIGSLQKNLKEGDIITVDICAMKDGWIGDNARTVPVGSVSDEKLYLIQSTEEAFFQALAFARRGQRVGEISYAIQRFVEKRGFGVVRDFVGHGVGRSMHEEPQIPNFGRRRSGPRLAPGMTLCIEPMVTMGRPEVDVSSDGWMAFTKDHSPAAHYEHTVLITQGEPEILTRHNLDEQGKKSVDFEKLLTTAVG